MSEPEDELERLQEKWQRFSGSKARPSNELEKSETALEDSVGRKAERHERARREARHTVWFGFGMFGLVGWAVTVPTLAGVALGNWLDTRYPVGPSWTITGLLAGLAIGCLNAWWWVQRSGAPDNDKDNTR